MAKLISGRDRIWPHAVSPQYLLSAVHRCHSQVCTGNRRETAPRKQDDSPWRSQSKMHTRLQSRGRSQKPVPKKCNLNARCSFTLIMLFFRVCYLGVEKPGPKLSPKRSPVVDSYFTGFWSNWGWWSLSPLFFLFSRMQTIQTLRGMKTNGWVSSGQSTRKLESGHNLGSLRKLRETNFFLRWEGWTPSTLHSAESYVVYWLLR